MILVSGFDSEDTREKVLDDVEIYLELLRLCEFDMAAIRMSQAYMWYSVTAFVVDDIREQRKRKTK